MTLPHKSRPFSAATRSAMGMRAGERGAAMLAALCFALVLAIVLSSYISMCYQSLKMSSRNANSGHSVELAETGMEEALWALHNNDWTGWSISNRTATKTISGFTFDSNTTGNATLSIANYDGVVATRSITVTGTTSFTKADGSTETQSRTLTSTATQAPLFTNAIAAVGNTTSTYNGVVSFGAAGTIDSYDSSIDINASSPGFSAVVASTSNVTSSNTVQMNNVNIKGYVATLSAGPSYSTSATLYGPSSPLMPKIDTSRVTTSPYQALFGVVTPSAPTPLNNGSQTIGTAGASTPTYYYYAGNYKLTTGQTLTVNGPVVIVISGYLWVDGAGSNNSGGLIHVTSTGSLTIFLAGDMRIDGGGITNDTKLPKNVAILGQTNNTNDMEFWTTVPFYGVMYLPQARLVFTNNPTYYGALVAQAVTFGATSSPTFHYDTNLRNVAFSGIDTPFAVANWREVSP